MRRAFGPLVAVVLAVFAASAWAGVVPNTGGPHQSGAKVKPVSQDQHHDKAEQAHEKEDSSKEAQR